MERRFKYLGPDHPFNWPINQVEIDSRGKPTALAVLLDNYKAKRDLKDHHLESLSGVGASTISRMRDDHEFRSMKMRSNLLRLIYAFNQYGVLEYVEEANELLDSVSEYSLGEVPTNEDRALLELLDYRPLSDRELEFEVTAVLEEEDIYSGAADLLQRYEFKHVRAYGPLALWQPSKYKKPEWFAPVVEYLSSHPDAQAQMVFGTPYHREYYEKMKDTLSVFQALEPPGNVPDPETGSIAIRYIPPFQKQPVIPTIGMIVFDSEYVSFGFSIADKMDKIDTGWVIKHQETAQAAVDWFDKKIWPEYHENDLLRTEPRIVRLCDGFDQLESLYGDRFSDEW